MTPELRVADVAFNTGKIIEALARAAAQGVRLAFFPELSITSYSCADLFYQSTLLDQARRALMSIAKPLLNTASRQLLGCRCRYMGDSIIVRHSSAKAVLSGSSPRAICRPPANSTSSAGSHRRSSARQTKLRIDDVEIPFGADLLFAIDNVPGCTIGIEICEDLWAVSPPSGELAVAGATVLLNPSASNELLGKVEYRRDLVRQQSARCLAAYLYAGTGSGESTTDTVYAGHCMVAENGSILVETERFQFDTQMAVVDIDVQRLVHERIKNSSFAQATPARPHRIVHAHFAGGLPGDEPALLRPNLVPHALCARRPGPARPQLPRNLQHPIDRSRQTAQAHRRTKSGDRRFGWPRFDAGPAGDRPRI